MLSRTKALNIYAIIDEVIWLSHVGSCESIACQDPFTIDPNGCRDHAAHLRALSRCILVCKLWANIGIPQLWRSYTKDKNLLALINVVHWRDKPCGKKYWSGENHHESTVDADLEMIPRSHLDRWNFYTEYVRRLTINGLAGEDYGKDYNPESFLKLAHLEEQPILPCLKALFAYGSWLEGSSTSSILATILSQSVRHLGIHLSYQSNHREILETIHQHAPELRYLELLGVSSERHCNILSKLLTSLPSLQVLRLDPDFVRGDLLESIGVNLLQLRILDFQGEPRNQEVYATGLPVSARPKQGAGAKLPDMVSLLLESGPENCCSLGDIIGKAFGRNHSLRFLSVVHKDFICANRRPVEECISRYCEGFSSTFPSMEFFSLDSLDIDNPTFKIEVVKPLLQCIQLTELSLIGFKVLDGSEFTRFLTCWSNLTKLEIIGPQMAALWFANTHDEEFAWQIVGEIAEGKLEGMEGMGLDCLREINAYLPHLKTLRLTLVASPTEHLEPAPQPFENLETLELTHSFWNFRLPDFDHGKAAHFASSFMNSTTEFIFQEDDSLESDLREGGESDALENLPWMDYSREYNQFCEQFQEKVDLAYDAPLDE